MKFNKNQTLTGNTLIGSEASPVVYHVNGDVTLTDNMVGYGILFVKGDFKMSKNAKWYGLIYRYGNGGTFEMRDNATLYGAAVARSVTDIGMDPDDGAPMKMYVLDKAQILYSSFMLKLMAGLVPALTQVDESEFIVERESETPERTGWVLSLRDMDAYAENQEAYEAEMLNRQETSLYDQIKLSAETE